MTTYLQYIARLEGNARLCARDEVVLERVVVKLSPNVYLLEDTVGSRKSQIHGQCIHTVNICISQFLLFS